MVSWQPPSTLAEAPILWYAKANWSFCFGSMPTCYGCVVGLNQRMRTFVGWRRLQSVRKTTKWSFGIELLEIRSLGMGTWSVGINVATRHGLFCNMINGSKRSAYVLVSRTPEKKAWIYFRRCFSNVELWLDKTKGVNCFQSNTPATVIHTFW